MEPCNVSGGGRIFYCNPSKGSFSTSTYSTNQKDSSMYYCPKYSSLAATKCFKRTGKQQQTKTENVLRTLRKTCVLYVVHNFHLVDSLFGLPELIGEELFNGCADFGYFQFDTEGNWCKALDVFTQAYGNLVLQTLNLSGKWMFLASCLENISLFEHLEEIDFSSCKIGDNHDALTYLGRLQHLTKLGLSFNSISCNGIKNLTMSHRRKGIGLESLELLRLDGNPKIGADALSYLETLPLLRVIVADYSEKLFEDLKLNSRKNQKFNACPHNIRFHNEIFKPATNDTVAVGWAARLIESYENDMASSMREKQAQKSEKEKRLKSFYKRQPTLGQKQDQNKEKQAKNHLVICECLFKLPNNKRQLISKRALKRPPDNLTEDTRAKKKCAASIFKRPPITADASKNPILDASILDLYLPC